MVNRKWTCEGESMTDKWATITAYDELKRFCESGIGFHISKVNKIVNPTKENAVQILYRDGKGIELNCGFTVNEDWSIPFDT